MDIRFRQCKIFNENWQMRITYKQRIIGYFMLVFILFSISITLFERSQEKKYRTANLEAKLDGYAELIHSYISNNPLDSVHISSVRILDELLPESIRITIVDKEGKVLFDKDVTDVDEMDNHLTRPEILNALYSSYGSNIRMSASTQQEYLYYAKYYNHYYVRVALPYTVETKNLLRPDNLFVYIILALFVIVLLLVNYIAGRFSKSIIQLKDFASRIKKGLPVPETLHFPEDELGEIGRELTDIFKQMEINKQNLEIEREKLIRHFQFSGEGLCIFNPEMKKIYANTNFIQYLNLLTDKPTLDVEDMFKHDLFNSVTEFIYEKEKESNHYSFLIDKNGKTFSIQTIIFEDNSFEITIRDVTQLEKTRLLKQQMTSNIAHELRTPVTSLRGYLETLSSNQMEPEKQKLFIDRAFLQTVRLSNLIDDVGIISKMEEAPSQFPMEAVNLSQLINEIRIDLIDKLEKNHIKFLSNVNTGLVIRGNYTLLHSVFRNLIDNSIHYGGENIGIYIDMYMQDDLYLYFSYYDTGLGVKEQHLNRLFERFYRVGEGRTRDTGGSGLGLSIVKNAVKFHQGTIQVKNRSEGGLEFLFTLKK